MSILHSFHRLIVILCLSVFLMQGAGCTSSASDKPSSQSQTVNTEPTAVFFADQVHAEFAKGFRIRYHENYKLLEILKPFQDKTDTLRYSLVPREIADKVDIANTVEIAIPVRSLVATSTTHIGLTNMLNANEIITGIAGAQYVYNKQIRKRIRQDRITTFSQGKLNREKMLVMHPDVLMISGGQSAQFGNYQVLQEAGIDVLVNSEWLETTPLGKAEWVKVMAALLNKEKLANRKFREVVQKYQALKARVQNVQPKPLVINNMPYKDAWFVSGGNSFTAQFFKDAGADYPWFDTEATGGLRKGFEVVYKQGLKAEVWVNPGTAKTKADIIAKDPRFRDFKSFRTGRIYNSYRRSNRTGGNDFWESGVVHPEIVLADLIKIFHPTLMPDHTLYYYQKVK